MHMCMCMCMCMHMCMCMCMCMCMYVHVRGVRSACCQEHLPLQPLSPHADGQLREEGELGAQHCGAHLMGHRGVCKGV
jgi:hypothetical protein